MNADIPLAQFVRVRPPRGASSRATAGALTTALYAFLALLAWLPSPPPLKVSLSETTAILLPDPPRKVIVPPPPFLARLIKPRAVSVAPPSFTVESAPPPPAPAQLPASAATVSPLAGGAPQGMSAGDGAASGSANGKNGNGENMSGCFDAAWGRAVSDRVGEFYRRPRDANHAKGVVRVEFTIRRSGWLDMLKIGKSSGDEMLDQAAVRMVRRAQPLPGIPERMHMERITVELPISFGSDDKFQPSPGSCGG
jgi:protein TonB